jgi:hypothetical protein
MVPPMTRKQNVCSGSTDSHPAVSRSRLIIVDAATLAEGLGEVVSLSRAHDHTGGRHGVTAVRSTTDHRTLVAAYPDPAVPAGVTETRPLWLSSLAGTRRVWL